METINTRRLHQELVLTSKYLSFCMLIYLVFSMFLPRIMITILKALGFKSFLTANNQFTSQIASYIFSLFSYTAILVIPFFMYVKMLDQSLDMKWTKHKLNPAYTTFATCSSLAMIVVSNFLVVFIDSFFSKADLTIAVGTFNKPTGGPLEFVLLFLYFCILPPILEEFVFRGIILHSLTKFGNVFAIIISSIMFALVHRNIAQGIHAFIMGCIMAYFVLRTDNLKTSMIIHFANNLYAVINGLIHYYLPVQIGRILSISMLFLLLLIGLITLFPLTRIHYQDLNNVNTPSPLSAKKYLTMFTTPSAVLMLVVYGYFFITNISHI